MKFKIEPNDYSDKKSDLVIQCENNAEKVILRALFLENNKARAVRIYNNETISIETDQKINFSE